MSPTGSGTGLWARAAGTERVCCGGSGHNGAAARKQPAEGPKIHTRGECRWCGEMEGRGERLGEASYRQPQALEAEVTCTTLAWAKRSSFTQDVWRRGNPANHAHFTSHTSPTRPCALPNASRRFRSRPARALITGRGVEHVCHLRADPFMRVTRPLRKSPPSLITSDLQCANTRKFLRAKDAGTRSSCRPAAEDARVVLDPIVKMMSVCPQKHRSKGPLSRRTIPQVPGLTVGGLFGWRPCSPTWSGIFLLTHPHMCRHA